MMEITSLSNNKCKYIKALSQKKARQKYGEYVVEGIKSVCDAVKSTRTVTALYVSSSFHENETFEYPADIPIYKAADEVFAKMCDTKTPQGILAVIKIENGNNFELNTRHDYVYCDHINDPGNLGTIIRSADAAGFGGVLLSPECADLYSPKTVRASMGSFFNIDVAADVDYNFLIEYKRKGFSLFGGALAPDTVDYRTVDFSKPSIIIVGNEANGISEELLKICQKVKIPILGGAESLNAGVAASILMYELVRQRY